MAPSRMKLRVRRQDNASSGNVLPESDEEEERQQRRQDRRRGTSTRSRSRRKNNNNSSRTNNTTTEASNNTSNTSANVPSAAPLPSSSSTATSRQVVSAEDTSPDSKCPICLDRFNNLAYLDRCLHRFCFMCIQEWSHNKAECPLCKQPFASILHSVRGENDFKKYTLRRSPENGSVAATVAMVAAMASDHRMRLTLRRSSTTRHRRNQRMVPVWEWLVDSPPDSPEYIPISPVTNVAEETQPFDLAERGIIFEGLTGLGSAASLSPFVANNRETRKLLFRLAARRRLQREGGRVRPLRDRETIALRRGLYRCGIRVRGIAGNSQDQPQREISVESFCHNPSSLNRLRPWIRRELAVLYGSHDSLITIVQRIIMARIARHGLEDLPVVEDELRPFLLMRTDHFLHELVSFARSPLTMENYDGQAIYEPPDVAFNVDALDSSTDSSAVIAISEEDEERDRGGAVEPVQESQASLSMSGWDDETPGPSYSTADSSCYLSSFSPALHDLSTAQDRGETLPQTPASPRQRGEDEAEEECLIVGYKKPIAERTPELVQLSSDSEDEKKKEGKEEDGEMKKGEMEEEGKEEEKEITEKQPEQFFPALSPSPCGEEIVEDAQPSRSHSDSPNPGQSLTEVLLRVLGGGDDRSKSKRKKRERRRNKRRRSSSGTSQNQNSSPLSSPCGRFSHDESHDSSFDSDFRGYSIISPLNSSCPSTPKSSSSPCFGSSASITPPPPREKVQNAEEDAAAAVAEKPGGKRKYKSRHLDSHARDPTWKPSSGKGSKSKSKAKELERIRKEEREKRRRRRRRERRKRRREESRGDRSPSVEIVFEGTVSGSAPKHKRRRQRDTLLSSPPLVITLDSDSDRGLLLDHSSSACSSPFGSQQTVNFCSFPQLPLVHSSAVGGALEGRDIGELPVDILDRESEKSDSENRLNKSSDLISLENSSDSNTDIDVEKVEMNKALNCEVEEIKEEPQRLKLSEDKATSSKSRKDFEESSEISVKSSSDDADKKLLDSILSVLDGITSKPDLPSTSNPGFPPSNHFKNNVLSDKPKNHAADRFPSSFYPMALPPFQQLTENRTKAPPNPLSSVEKSHTAAKRTEELANEFRTMHNLETRREIANSLLALRDPENSLTGSDSVQNDALSSQSNRIPSEISTSRSTPNSDSLLANLNEKTQTDLVHEKVCSDSRADLDIRNYNSTNAEDVK